MHHLLLAPYNTLQNVELRAVPVGNVMRYLFGTIGQTLPIRTVATLKTMIQSKRRYHLISDACASVVAKWMTIKQDWNRMA